MEEYLETLKAVDDGVMSARTKLAWFLLSGFGGCPRKADDAVALLVERVKDRDAEAMWMLGLCKEYAMGTKQDIDGADYLYQQSRAGGNAIGDNLAAKNGYGRGTRKMKWNGL